jgi:hypothetical protein
MVRFYSENVRYRKIDDERILEGDQDESKATLKTAGRNCTGEIRTPTVGTPTVGTPTVGTPTG